MPPLPPADVEILAERLLLGIPLLGMDGEPIPLRDPEGRPYGPIEAAILLLHSAMRGLEADVADASLAASVERAVAVEDAAIAQGHRGFELDRRIAGVFVSAAVRADLLGRHGDLSPTDLNRATLDWYQVHQVRRAALLSSTTWGTDRTA